MSLEVQIGADKSDFDKKIKEVEFDIKELSKEKAIQIKAGLDTTEITKNIKDAKKSLLDLKTTLKDTGNAFQGSVKPIANGGNALMQFSRIAQDAPFGIMGIGNNITATVESFNHLKQSTGSTGGALKALAGSIMGSGGILLGVSLLTTGLTIMSQQGLTVGDVFNKLTGRFDEFKKSMQEVNEESAKQSGEQVATAKAYVNAAQDVNLSMSDRLIAVKKLQDEYPAYFGNLTKEQILNGNVTLAVKELTQALIAKAKASAYAGKIGEVAAKKVPLRDKEAELIKEGNEAIKKRQSLEQKLASEQFSEATFKAWQRQDNIVKDYKNSLADVQSQLRGLNAEEAKWTNQLNKNVEGSLGLEFDPEKTKIKKVKELHVPVEAVNIKSIDKLTLPGAFDIGEALSKQYSATTFDPLASLNERFEKSRLEFINRLKTMATQTTSVLFSWNEAMSSAFSGIGDSIGQALASGGNVLESIGASLLGSLGSLLSQLGDKLIVLGTTAVLAGTVLATMFTPAGIAAGLAAIAVGVGLKAGGGLASGLSNKMTSGSGGNGVSAGNSVSSPTSSVSSGGSYSGGMQNVVFEISGQSLVGVLSNTLNKNVKLGGTISI